MSNEQEIQEIELQISSVKEMIDTADALERLRSNPDFKMVIEEGYFNQNAIRLVSLKAAPAMASEENQISIVRGIDAIGEFQQYLNSIITMGEQSKQMVEDAREQLTEIEKAA